MCSEYSADIKQVLLMFNFSIIVLYYGIYNLMYDVNI